ncbi:MAG TPA: hypothetical protein VHL53_21405 [Acidimicrobiia bacterium]|nr:hypothetical protein [Acidimicrobiia bacterium]
MAGLTRRRRSHAAASARILTAGLRSAAAFGIVAGLAVNADPGHQSPSATAQLPAGAASPPASPGGSEVVVVRRHWIPVPAGAAPAAGSTPSPPAAESLAIPARPAPLAASQPAPAVAARPAPRPVTRTRGS